MSLADDVTEAGLLAAMRSWLGPTYILGNNFAVEGMMREALRAASALHQPGAGEALGEPRMPHSGMTATEAAAFIDRMAAPAHPPSAPEPKKAKIAGPLNLKGPAVDRDEAIKDGDDLPDDHAAHPPSPPAAKALVEALSPDAERLCRERGMEQWEASLKRPDLSEKDRVGGAVDAALGERLTEIVKAGRDAAAHLTSEHQLRVQAEQATDQRYARLAEALIAAEAEVANLSAELVRARAALEDDGHPTASEAARHLRDYAAKQRRTVGTCPPGDNIFDDAAAILDRLVRARAALLDLSRGERDAE